MYGRPYSSTSPYSAAPYSGMGYSPYGSSMYSTPYSGYSSYGSLGNAYDGYSYPGSANPLMYGQNLLTRFQDSMSGMGRVSQLMQMIFEGIQFSFASVMRIFQHSVVLKSEMGSGVESLLHVPPIPAVIRNAYLRCRERMFAELQLKDPLLEHIRAQRRRFQVLVKLRRRNLNLIRQQSQDQYHREQQVFSAKQQQYQMLMSQSQPFGGNVQMPPPLPPEPPPADHMLLAHAMHDPPTAEENRLIDMHLAALQSSAANAPASALTSDDPETALDDEGYGYGLAASGGASAQSGTGAALVAQTGKDQPASGNGSSSSELQMPRYEWQPSRWWWLGIWAAAGVSLWSARRGFTALSRRWTEATTGRPRPSYVENQRMLHNFSRSFDRAFVGSGAGAVGESSGGLWPWLFLALFGWWVFKSVLNASARSAAEKQHRLAESESQLASLKALKNPEGQPLLSDSQMDQLRVLHNMHTQGQLTPVQIQHLAHLHLQLQQAAGGAPPPTALAVGGASAGAGFANSTPLMPGMGVGMGMGPPASVPDFFPPAGNPLDFR